MNKTNAMRMLDKANIAYKAVEYTVDESDLSGVHIAESLGLPCEKIFKTLVARGDKTGIVVLCIPVDKELDLKKVATVTGNKKIEMIHVRELLGLTGYIRGGCSPIGMKKKYPTFLDSSCMELAEIAVSAGVRGCQLFLSPTDLASQADATVSASLIK